MSKKKPNPYDISAIFEAMTIDLINSLKRNIGGHKANELREGFRWEMWQKAKLRNIRAYRKRNKKGISKWFARVLKLVDVVTNFSFRRGERRFERQLKQAMKSNKVVGAIKRTEIDIKVPQEVIPELRKGVPSNKHKKLYKAPKETAFFGMNERKLEALQESVKGDLKKAENGVMRKMDDVYRQTIYKAEVNMAAGAKTLDQAIDMATKDFLQKGINTIEYTDGRRVNIASWAEMALRTASQRATFLGEGKKRDEFGVYTVLMSAHNDCSPMCLPYQGTVMIDDVYTSISNEAASSLSKETGYVLLSVAMEKHAFHPNCRHTLSTFFPGINSMPEPVDDEKAVANYQAEQKQRYYERGIRMYKRLYEGSLDEVNQLRYKKKVNEWQSRLRDHLKENPSLRRDYSREKVG